MFSRHEFQRDVSSQTRNFVFSRLQCSVKTLVPFSIGLLLYSPNLIPCFISVAFSVNLISYCFISSSFGQPKLLTVSFKGTENENSAEITIWNGTKFYAALSNFVPFHPVFISTRNCFMGFPCVILMFESYVFVDIKSVWFRNSFHYFYINV